jgi:hypothetical protein
LNYDQARELETGGWHWTTRNDDVIRTAWPCLDCPPHATREEAERHFYEACLESVIERSIMEWRGCVAPGCKRPAWTTLGNPQTSRYFRPVPLCTKHCNRDTLRSLRSFEPGIMLWHS